MALTDTTSNHGILRMAIHNFVKQKWDSCMSSRSGLLEFWVNFVGFYVYQGGEPLLPDTYLSIDEYYRVTGMFCMFPLSDKVFEVLNHPPLCNKTYFIWIGADEVGNWAGSGEILAAAHLLQLRIGVFQDNAEGAQGWSWYPSHSHYPDSPVVLLYNISGDHFTLIERVSPAIVIS